PALAAQGLRDLAGCVAELALLVVVIGERGEDPDRLRLRRAVSERHDREPPYRLVVVARGELVQCSPHAVDDARMVAREPLEREQRRAAAGGALVLETAREQLDLLPVAELGDRAERDHPLAVVGRARRRLDLVVPLPAQLRELLLLALLRERVGLRRRVGERHRPSRCLAGGPT